jgi:hypothetical protein
MFVLVYTKWRLVVLSFSLWTGPVEDIWESGAESMWKTFPESRPQLTIWMNSFIHSFLRHVQNVTILCRSQELLPFLSVMYFFL